MRCKAVPQAIGKNKKKKVKGKGKGGETGVKGTMPLEVLNSFRRSQHMGPLLDLPETTGKLGDRTLLDSPAARNKKALLDSPSSSDEDSLDLSLSPLPGAGGEKVLNSSRMATTEAAILDIADLSIEQTWESMLDQSLEDDRLEQEERREVEAVSATNMPRFEDVLPDGEPLATAQRQREASKEDESANSFPADEKEGEDSPDEEGLPRDRQIRGNPALGGSISGN